MLEAALAGLFGLLIGSFLNVCIYRMPEDLSVVRPRSYCPECKRMIAWYDNIPLLSYVLLRGRCRQCGSRISLRYPLVELLTGGLFFFVVYSYGVSMPALKLLIFAALLIGLVFSDMEKRTLPDEFTLGGIAAGLVLAVLVPLEHGIAPLLFPAEWGRRGLSLAEAVIGAAIPSGLMWLLGLLYERVRGREGLGLGDVKMVGMIGAFVGLQGAMLAVLMGSLLGSVIGVLYILLTGKKMSTYELPFGSFLGIGAMAVALLAAAAT